MSVRIAIVECGKARVVIINTHPHTVWTASSSLLFLFPLSSCFCLFVCGVAVVVVLFFYGMQKGSHTKLSCIDPIAQRGSCKQDREYTVQDLELKKTIHRKCTSFLGHLASFFRFFVPFSCAALPVGWCCLSCPRAEAFGLFMPQVKKYMQYQKYPR